MHRVRVASALVALLVLPSVSGATEGVLEINQACALAGCFPGDAAGFPVEITASGSYELTGNLDVSVSVTPAPPAATAIQIGANEVSIDLRGFTISGVTTCSFGSCSNTGNGSGIAETGGVRERISVRDGVIRGMGRYGIACDQDCSVENVKVVGNGSLGIIAFNGPARMHGNIVRNNGGGGIRATGLISENVIEFNGGIGWQDSGPGSGGSSIVSRNRVTANTAGGVLCSYADVLDNVLGSNSSYELKIETGSVCALGRNVIVGTLDNSVGSFVQVDSNMCGGDLTCP